MISTIAPQHEGQCFAQVAGLSVWSFPVLSVTVFSQYMQVSHTGIQFGKFKVTNLFRFTLNS